MPNVFSNYFKDDEAKYVRGDEAAIVRSVPAVFNNVADAKAGNLASGGTVSLEVGRAVLTLGYTLPNDNGEAAYRVVAGGTGTEDGILYLNMTNGNQLERLDIGQQVFDTVADAVVAAWLGIGDSVKTEGYSTANDGGGTDYIVVAGGTGTNDGILYINSANGYQLQRQPIDKQVFDTVAQAKAAAWIGIGDSVQTQGYNSVNDGGGARYVVVAGGTGTDDGILFIDKTDGSGLQLERLPIPTQVFDTTGDMIAALWLGIGDTATTKEYSSGNGGGENYTIVAPSTGTDDGGSYFDLANTNQAEIRPGLQVDGSAFGLIYNSTINTTQYRNFIAYCSSNSVKAVLTSGFSDTTESTILIPTDFSTLQEAFDFINVSGFDSFDPIDIKFETGHAPTAGGFVSGYDMQRVTISSVDAVVTLDPSFNVATDFLGMTESQGPVLNCLINANGVCRYGVNVQNGSNMTVNPNCGVRNATQRGIYLNQNSSATADSADFTGTGSVVAGSSVRGAWVARGSTLICENADFSDSAGIGVYASRASTIHAMDLKAQNCGQQAVWIHRSSRFTAHSVGNGGVLLSTDSTSIDEVVRVSRTSLASINADAGTAPVVITQNGSGDGVTCQASLVELNAATLVGSATSANGIDCTSGGTVNASNANISAFTDNISVNGGVVNAPLATITAAKSDGVSVNRGEVNLASASVTGSASLDINNNSGSFTRAGGCTTTSGAGTPALADTNVPAFNALTSRGVIFT